MATIQFLVGVNTMKVMHLTLPTITCASLLLHLKAINVCPCTCVRARTHTFLRMLVCADANPRERTHVSPGMVKLELVTREVIPHAVKRLEAMINCCTLRNTRALSSLFKLSVPYIRLLGIGGHGRDDRNVCLCWSYSGHDIRK